MSDSLQDRVVNLIPSRDLRKAIVDNNFVLTDLTLLSTVYHCAPDYASRIHHLKMLEAAFSGEIQAYTSRIIATQQQMLNAFVKEEPGVAFELHIKDTPDSYDETYLCSSFDAAFKLIPLFHQHYDCSENTSSRYRIVKRRVFSGNDGDPFSEDYLGKMRLLPGGIVESVDMTGYCAEDCDGLCFDCNHYCVLSGEILYPCFTAHADAVKYRDYGGFTRYGVVLQWETAPSGECYIIPLNCEQIRYHDFQNAHYAHQHIPAPFVEVISPDTLPQEMQENYLAFAAYLKENDAWA